MKEKAGRSFNKRKKEANKQLVIILFALVATVVLGAYVFLDFYGTYIDGVLYAERLSQMQEVTGQLFNNLEEIVNSQWEMARAQCNYLEEERPATADELVIFMGRQARMNDFAGSHSEMMAVDDTGRYYTQNGMQGTLSGLNYILNQPERTSYVYSTMTTGQSEMVFLMKLPDPVPVQVGERQVRLTYCGVSRNMGELKPYFSCEAYGGNNSVYVLAGNGIKLFSDSDDELLKGHNLYTVLEKMEYLHGSSFNEARQELREHRIAYSNAVLNGQEYYYSLYQMENAAWTLLFLVPSVYVATNTVGLINMTVRMVLWYALGIVSICVIFIYLVLRLKQKQAIDAERKNGEVLTKINEELDQKNAELSKAVDAARQATESAWAAMRKAEAASKAKSEFLSNMSHDIRTPMNAIVGITNLMEHEGNVSDRLHGYIQKIKFSSRHLLSLINDILDMSKIESSEIELNEEKVSLSEQVGQVDSIIRSQTNEKGQIFHIYIHEIAHEYLIGDSVRLRQIFLNLLSNAVKYTANGGEIVFDITELPCDETGYAEFCFSVTDTGYGMKPEFLEHIFEPFTRAENSVTNKIQGTGLGMAITKNIIDLMGGSIHVKSEFGKGSCFDVILKFKIDGERSYDLKKEKILLISADQTLTKNIQAPLRLTELAFTVVSTEKEAVQFLKEENVDVILLAGHLRDKSLKDTVKLLRDLSKDTLLIFCVDFAQREAVQETLSQCRIDGLIPRPFFLSNLEIAIARVRSNAAPETEGLSILNGMHFLCAEDNNLNAEILEGILDMYGASCTIYPDGEEIVKAFEHVRPGEYDAILMDIQMPHMNGYEATKAIRRSKNLLGRTIPIIAMTANAFSDDVQNSLAAGMNAHVSKPIDMAVLEKTLRGLL